MQTPTKVRRAKPVHWKPRMVPVARYDDKLRSRIESLNDAAATLDDRLADKGLVPFVVVDGSALAGGEGGLCVVDPSKKFFDYCDFEERLPRVLIAVAPAFPDRGRLLAHKAEFYALFPDGDIWRGGLFKCGYHDLLVREYWSCEGPSAEPVADACVRHRAKSAPSGAVHYWPTVDEGIRAKQRFERKYGQSVFEGWQ